MGLGFVSRSTKIYIKVGRRLFSYERRPLRHDYATVSGYFYQALLWPSFSTVEFLTPLFPICGGSDTVLTFFYVLKKVIRRLWLSQIS